MKRILSLVLVLVSVLTYADSVQQGCVKTRGRMIDGKHIPGQGLPGSIVSIKDRTAIGVKNSNGTFSFPVTDNQFRVDSVKKKDYVLLDADVASKTYIHTADTLFFVMETPEQILQDKLFTERRLRRSLQTKLHARENELDSLISIQKISQEEYQQSLQKLYTEQSENDKLISDMAERYSTLDYDQMDEFYRQVSYYIEQCEFVKADSLLKTRGNLQAQIEAANLRGQAIHQDEEKLQRAKVVHQHDVDELAKRCYYYYENFLMQYQNDSAAYFLEQCIRLDSTKIELRLELASFLSYLAQFDRAIELYINTLPNGEENDLTAFIYNALANCYYKGKADYVRALECLEKSLAIRKKIYGTKHIEVAMSYNNIGLMYEMKGDYINALEYYKKSLTLTESVLGLDNNEMATLYNNLASIYYSLEDNVNALKYLEKCITIREKIYREEESNETAISYYNKGMFLIDRDTTQALSYFKRSLVIREKIYGKNHPEVAQTYWAIGCLYEKVKKHALALEYFNKSLVIREKIYGMPHPEVAETYNMMGVSYHSLGDYTQALNSFEKSLVIREKIYNMPHPEVAILYSNIASVHSSQHNHILALENYEKSLMILEKTFGENHSKLAVTFNNIGITCDSLGKYDYAVKYFEKSLSIFKKTYGEEHSYVVQAYSNIGMAYLNSGQYINALENLKKSLKISEKIYNPRHGQIAELNGNIALCYLAQEDFESALVYFRKAIKIYEVLEGIDSEDVIEFKNLFEDMFETLKKMQ